MLLMKRSHRQSNMALPGSGTITWEMIRAEFGGGYPIYINQYYRGGARVPNTPANANVPTSGTIYASQFYNATNYTAVGITGPTSAYNSRTGAGSVSVGVAMGGTGGTGSYTYSWVRLSGATNINISSTTVSNPSFSTSFATNTNASRSAVWRCTVSDGTTSAIRDVTVTLEEFQSGGGVIP